MILAQLKAVTLKQGAFVKLKQMGQVVARGRKGWLPAKIMHAVVVSALKE